MGVSPWAVLFSWQKPRTSDPIKNFVIDGDLSYTVTTHLNEKYQFLFLDKNITPGTYISIRLHVHFASGYHTSVITGTDIGEPGKF